MRFAAFLLSALVHALLITLLLLQPASPPPPAKARVRVQTVKLQEGKKEVVVASKPLPQEKEVVVTPKPLPAEPVITVAEPLPAVIPEPVAALPEPMAAPSPTVTPPAKKPKKTAKASESKPKAKAKKKSSTPSSKPKKEKKTTSSEESAVSQAARDILQTLQKGGSAVVAKGVSGTIYAATAVGSLKSEAVALFDSSEYTTADQRCYQDELAYTLQTHLVLPEQGDVTVLLTLHSDGKVKTVKIKETESSKNSSYIKERLPQLRFAAFKELFAGEKEQTFTITLCNKS